MKEATEQMKQELGPEAIILNTKKISNGKHFNFLGKEMLEVTAAIDDQPLQRPVPAPIGRDEAGFNQLLQRAASASVREPAAGDTFEGLKNVAEHFEKRAAKVEEKKPLLPDRQDRDSRVEGRDGRNEKHAGIDRGTFQIFKNAGAAAVSSAGVSNVGTE